MARSSLSRRRYRRSRPLAGVKATLDLERVAEMREDPTFYRGAAEKVNQAACRIVKRGAGWDKRKVFLADVAAEVGSPMKRLASLLLPWNNLGWVELARADLTAAMDPNKVSDSEIEVEGRYGTRTNYHFLIIDPKSCGGLEGARRHRRRRGR